MNAFADMTQEEFAAHRLGAPRARAAAAAPRQRV
jgi:hypothetical protein